MSEPVPESWVTTAIPNSDAVVDPAVRQPGHFQSLFNNNLGRAERSSLFLEQDGIVHVRGSNSMSLKVQLVTKHGCLTL